MTMITPMTSIASVALNQVTSSSSGYGSNPGTSASTNQRASHSARYGSNHSSFYVAVLRSVVSPASLRTDIKDAECSDQHNDN
jgi:hypothetical protein